MHSLIKNIIVIIHNKKSIYDIDLELYRINMQYHFLSKVMHYTFLFCIDCTFTAERFYVTKVLGLHLLPHASQNN